MAKWNFVAMGEVGLTGWTKEVARPVARSIARRTGRPEAQILSLFGGVFLAIALIDFLREVNAVIAAGGRQPANDAPAAHAEGCPASFRHPPLGLPAALWTRWPAGEPAVRWGRGRTRLR